MDSPASSSAIRAFVVALSAAIRYPETVRRHSPASGVTQSWLISPGMKPSLGLSYS